MVVRLLLQASLILLLIGFQPAGAETPAGSPAPGATPTLPKPAQLAPFKKRLATARTVEVETSLLGIQLDSSLEAARKKLDGLVDRTRPPRKEEGEAGDEGESGEKIFWELTRSDFASIYLKADDKKRIIYIHGTLRPGKEKAFSEIGEVEKAPIHLEATVAWDVVRPDRPFTRVVAQGADGKAKTITIFVVKRPDKSELNR